MLTLTLIDPKTHKIRQQWQFQQSSVIRIGRQDDNDVVLGDFTIISRHHLELHPVNPSVLGCSWRLISQGANGTYLNGHLVKESLIGDQSVIQLAQDGPIVKFEFTANPQPQIVPATAVSACNHEGNSPKNLFCVHCGQPIVDQEEFVRHYQILRVLGQGGMGTTYIAWDQYGKTTGKPCLLVLKQMNADMEQIAKARELFEREARILKSLQHPGIPKYYDFFVERDRKYLAMELCHGQNLEQRITQYGPVLPNQAIQWMVQTCDILAYLHSLEPPLVHRDVKPANLMLRDLDQSIVLLDFGAVKEIGTPLGTRIGAEGYSAPEQDRGQPCPQSDLYAIGPTLIFLLTGQPPLKYYVPQGQEYRFQVRDIPSMTPQLAIVIEKVCESRLRDRYATAQELQEALIGCVH